MLEKAIQSQFSIWVPTGDDDLEAEYLLAASQTQFLIQKMLRAEITPDELVEALADFLPVPVETYIEEVEENLRDLEMCWGIPLTG